jgi:SulP family sulfate permease
VAWSSGRNLGCGGGLIDRIDLAGCRTPLVTLGRSPGTNVFRDHSLHPTDQTYEGLLIVRIDGRLFFANARRVVGRLLEMVDRPGGKPDVLLLDVSAVVDLDVTAGNALRELTRELQRRAVDLWASTVRRRPREMIERAERWDELLAEGRVYDALADAVAAYETRRGG